MFWSDFHCLTTLALWHGAPSSWKMCWGNGRVPENIQIAILVEVAFQWSEKPSSSVRHCTPHSHATAIKLHCGYNTTVSVCFMRSSPRKHPTIVLKEWILTRHSKAQLTNQPKSNLHVPLRIVTFFCAGLLLSEFFFQIHIWHKTSFFKWCLMLGRHSVSIQFLSVGLYSDCLTSSLSSLCVDILRRPGLYASF